MAPSKMFLVLLAMLFAVVFAHPDMDYTIHGLKVVDDEEDEPIKVIDDPSDDPINVIDPVSRAQKEKAVHVVKSVESGFARTTNVGITVQKGTSGTIHFKIQLKAITVEKLLEKTRFFRKQLSKVQKKALRKLQKKYKGRLDVPWLKFLNVDLSKDANLADFEAARAKILTYDKLAVVAKKLLKEVVAQKIEVKGTLHAKGVSFIPTTVFSFIKLARVEFEDASTTIVVNEHIDDAAVATKDGKKVLPHTGDIKIF